MPVARFKRLLLFTCLGLLMVGMGIWNHEVGLTNRESTTDGGIPRQGRTNAESIELHPIQTNLKRSVANAAFLKGRHTGLAPDELEARYATFEAASEVRANAFREKRRAWDSKMGFNQEVWAVEDELRKRSENLRPGLSQLEVQDLLGAPRQVGFTKERLMSELGRRGVTGPEILQRLQIQPDNKGIVHTSRWLPPEEAKVLPVVSSGIEEPYFVYSPHPQRVEVYSAGDSFEILYVWFDAQSGKVVKSKWTPPLLTR